MNFKPQFGNSKIIQWLIPIGFLFLGLMTLGRFIHYLTFPPVGTDAEFSFIEVFFLGLRFDARIVGTGCLIPFLLGILPFFNPFKTKSGKRFSQIYWITATISFFLFYFTDFGYYGYLHTGLNADVLNLAEEGSTSWGMLWETYPIIKMLLGLGIGTWLLYIFIFTLLKRIAQKGVAQDLKHSNILTGIFFFLFCGFFIFGRIGQYPLRWSDAFSIGNNYAANLALNPFQTFFSSLKHRNAGFDQKQVIAAYPLLKDFLNIPQSPTSKLSYLRVHEPFIKRDTPPNVVIVICESFSFVKSSMSGNQLNPTPYFKKLTENGLFFNRCFSPSTGTARGVWAVITGIPDVELNSTSSRNPAAVNQRTIINDFKGYDKSYYIGGSLSWANIRALLQNNIPGLKTIEQPDYQAGRVNVWGVSDKQMFERANLDFSKKKGPFLAIIQTADNHRPFTIPKEDLESLSLPKVSQKEALANNFSGQAELNAFRYTDYCFQRFIESAKKEKYFDHTIFVFVGDHGSAGDATKYFPDAWTGGRLDNFHIPLLFYAPKLIPPRTISQYASQVDLLPTLAALSGISYSNTTLGRNLLQTNLLDNSNRDALFIYDPYERTIGLIQDSVYFNYHLDRPQTPSIYSMLSNYNPKISSKDSLRYRNLLNGIYQTVRYMNLHNQRGNQP